MTVTRIATLTGSHGSLTLSNIDDPAGDVSAWLIDIPGWFGGVGVKGENTERAFGHGLFPEPNTRTGRALTMKGTLQFADERGRSLGDRFVSGLMGDGEFGDLTVEQDELTLSSTVKLDGEVRHAYAGTPTTPAIRFEVPLIAPDPFVYGPQRITQLFPAGFGEGLRFPLFAQGFLDFGNVAASSKVVVRNAGNAEAHPVVTVRGNFPSGFRLTDGRRVVEYADPVFDTSPAVVDMGAGAVYVNGTDRTHRCTRREWFVIPARGAIQPRITSLQQGDGWADVAVRDTYI